VVGSRQRSTRWMPTVTRTSLILEAIYRICDLDAFCKDQAYTLSRAYTTPHSTYRALSTLSPSSTRMGRNLDFLIIAVAAYALYSFFAKNREDPPPSRSQSPSFDMPSCPPSPSPHILSRPPLPPRPHVPSRRRDNWQHRQSIDVSQANSNYYYPSAETYYVYLRGNAEGRGKLMAICNEQSQDAHKRHEYALAKRLSDKAEEHAFEMERLNAQASAIKENNQANWCYPAEESHPYSTF